MLDKSATGDANVPRKRIEALDTLRGFTILSMVGFHAAYDLAYIFGQPMSWFTSGFAQELWRITISWTFLGLAGWMCAFSRNNVRRSIIYAAAALLVWVATSLAAVDAAVNFGILFCMAASTFIWAMAERLMPAALDRLPAVPTTVSLLALFIGTRGIPLERYPVEGLAWLGFPSASFVSGDYYPLLPFAFLYLAAAFASRRFALDRRPYPSWLMRDWLPPLTALGRMSLPIYLVHQPLILAALQVIFST